MTWINFNDCNFARAPSFGSSDQIPQRTTFHRATFTVVPEDEGAFRSIRNKYHALRARDDEGRFYAYEKRCQRRQMTPPREWVSRAISWLYDISSAYGSSYGRALLCLVAVQFFFGLIYSILSGRLTHFPATFDSQITAFTFAQVAKPFELFNYKGNLTGLYAIIPNLTPTGWWYFLTALHSVLAISLIALVLLAMRWRFRRE